MSSVQESLNHDRPDKDFTCVSLFYSVINKNSKYILFVVVTIKDIICGIRNGKSSIENRFVIF